MLSKFFYLWRLEYLSERRKRSSIPSVILYVCCIFFIIYQVHHNGSLNVDAVLSLYWVVQLFLSVWISFESIQSESIKRMLFWYQYIPTHLLFVVKCTYNMTLLCIFSNILWLVSCWLFLPSEFLRWELFFLLSFVSMAFGAVFSFVSYMVFIIQKQLGLVGVLGIPIVIPLLIITISLIKKIITIDIVPEDYIYQYVPFYLILVVLLMFSGVYLVPYLKVS